MQKILAISILIMGIALCGILVLINFTPSVESAAGLAHPDFEGMRIGGDGAARIEPIAILALVFQVIVLAQFACFIALGVSAHRRTPTFYGLLSVCFLITVFVWWSLLAGHRAYLESGETQYFFGFPTATAWVMYAVWLAGLSFVILYVVGFKQFVWSDSDETEFKKLLSDYPNDN